jgi:hypothetical protein
VLTFLASRWTVLVLAVLVNGAAVAIAVCESRPGFYSRGGRP